MAHKPHYSVTGLSRGGSVRSPNIYAHIFTMADAFASSLVKDEATEAHFLFEANHYQRVSIKSDRMQMFKTQQFCNDLVNERIVLRY